MGGHREGAQFADLSPHVPLFFSDDTQLTLATVESILLCDAVSAAHIAASFKLWFTAGRFSGLGSSTLKAMRDLAAGVHWALAGARGEYAAGNGAAMRIAPLAFLLDPHTESDRTLIRDVCRITHHSDEAYLGALAVVAAIHLASTSGCGQEYGFLDNVEAYLPDSALRDRFRELSASGLTPAQAVDRYGASGYVVDTVPLALLCAESITDRPLAEVLMETVSLGGDSDTIASICGQIAGAVAGEGGVPARWLKTIERIETVREFAEQFATLVCCEPRKRFS